MRLVCPNCGAQYQIDDAAIPEAGRDVQCSNCGHAWFQLPPAQEALAEAEEERALRAAAAAAGPVTEQDAQAPDGPAMQAPDPEAPPLAATAARAPDAPAPEPPAPETTAPEAPPTPPHPPVAEAPPRPPQSAVDESVLAIVREEAEREARARRAEAAALESQPDLGLQPRPQRVRKVAAARPPAPPAQVSAEPASAAEADPPGRRKQLPDIDEINSSLQPASDRSYADLIDEAGEEDEVRTRRRGFRIGFFTAFGLGAVLLGVYLAAPTLAARVPALEPALSAYVGALDTWRTVLADRLDSAIRALTERIS